MRLTEDRISHLSHLVIDRLDRDDVADFPDEAGALREAKAVFASWARAEEEADAAARRKIASLSRRVPEGGASGRSCTGSTSRRRCPAASSSPRPVPQKFVLPPLTRFPAVAILLVSTR